VVGLTVEKLKFLLYKVKRRAYTRFSKAVTFEYGGGVMRLDGKTAVVTGASRGLGRELALAYAREGAKGLVLVARGGQGLAETAAMVKKLSSRVKVLECGGDVSDARDIERISAVALTAFPDGIDVLVNNASVLGPSPMPYLLDYPASAFREVLATNVVGPFLLIQNFLPAMIERGGSIINVTSAAGAHGYPGWGAYGVSKFALEGLSETWAAELEDTRVRVNWVDPGNMDTEMHRLAEPDEDPSEWANPADVVEIFVHLASDDSADVSGQRFEAQAEETVA
jgi:NAD(P)-dependent dehydrogenase (short-subunit alcohol dehydrogenase family)